MRYFGFEERWARVAFETIFPGEARAGLVAMRAMDVEGFVRDTARRVPARAALGVRVAIWIATFAPIFVLGRAALLGGIEPRDRERVIAALLASDSYALRSLVLVLKTLGAMLYAGNASVRAAMNAEAKRSAPRSTTADRLVPLRLKSPHAA